MVWEQINVYLREFYRTFRQARPRDVFVVFILCLSLFLGLSEVRIFPFSSFPMFSYLARKPAVYSIVVVHTDERRSNISSRLLVPLTRLHLAQYVFLNLKRGRPPSEWLGWIKDRVAAAYPDAKAIELVIHTFSEEVTATVPYTITKTQVLFELPVVPRGGEGRDE